MRNGLHGAAQFGVIAMLLHGCAHQPSHRARWILPSPTATFAADFQIGHLRLATVQAKRFSSELTLTNLESVLKIEVIADLDAASASTMIEDGMMGLQALYANALSPYPGDISREVVSDRRFRPQMVSTNIDGRSLNYALVFANERFGYGVASADAVRYRSLVGWIHCANRSTLYKVRHFAPLTVHDEDLVQFYRRLQCPN
jgi:hypothetical protein